MYEEVIWHHQRGGFQDKMIAQMSKGKMNKGRQRKKRGWQSGHIVCISLGNLITRISSGVGVRCYVGVGVVRQVGKAIEGDFPLFAHFIEHFMRKMYLCYSCGILKHK